MKVAAAALLLCLTPLTAPCQSPEKPGSPLFTVSKTTVPLSEFTYLYRKNHREPEEFTPEKIDAYLDLFIRYKLKVEEARTRGMDTTAAFRKEYETYRNELLKPYLPDERVIDSMVALTYERLKEEVNASHVLIAVRPDALPADTLAAYKKAAAVRHEALRGTDFGDLAAKYSEEPGAAGRRGNLGFFTALQMVFPFEQAAYTTPVGGVSEVIRTQFGYHVVKVLERRPSRGEVEVSHIMLRTEPGSNDDETRNTIFDIYDQLQKGVSWDELCQQYSEDPGSKDRGGRLRPFGVGGMATVPEFQDMAFAMKKEGEISDPFQTQFGWHIIRLESRIPLPPFEELKASLTQRVSRDERVTISRDALRERMRAKLGFREDAKVKTLLMEATTLVDTGSLAATAGATLFTMKDKPYTVRDFLQYARAQSRGQRAGSRHDLEGLYQQYLDAVQLQVLEEKVLEESPDHRWLLNEYYEGILLFEIMEKEVWNRAMDDSTGQRSYFETHRSQYRAGERMQGKIYSSPSKEYLWQLKSLLEKEDSTYREFISRNKIRVESGTFEKTARPVLSEINWAPGLWPAGKGSTHYLVVVEQIIPPGPQSFAEARASVISDYQKALEDQWVNSLRQKFGVTVNKKVKKQAVRMLMADEKESRSR